ncbi:HPF/RaiA family ribosome-associated protein [Oceanidesulfovibrio marinus]|uniref:HPF/RaiA family ribosome-associated protein n=1 Tax=Oceanidesulfovibrio marinus TaxID=370038 RepID=A0A6P1ZBH0_9BACT|nr:HPF/RaiA family ribosome-associated protein [Oceanidesulfovibrio marinus]QJT11025.1 HPF/RaiA family ribosome-associated protein [Oceanidesulfovibrio marinus]TVM31358.1 HPF/RaiA family ribosome-associated protein [Oceanidesulfovibrio marinus]
MDVPIEISITGIEDRGRTIENLVRSKSDKLEQVCDHITSLRVAVEMEDKNQRGGNPFRIRLNLNVAPGKEFAIEREAVAPPIPAELLPTVREAFDAARRKLQKITEKQRGEVKQHPMQQANAVVAKVFHGEDYGFLRTLDERDVYFHKNAVVGRDFDDLRQGAGVVAAIVQGDKGLQATSVQVVDMPSL